jgi:hypothetical protein
MARVARLRKQRHFFKKRKIKITRRGLRFLNDLDAIKVKELKEKEA